MQTASRILIPDPLDSDQQYNRFYHHDLAGMAIDDLLDELYAIRSRLWLLKSDRYAYLVGFEQQRRFAGWLRERISRIGAELRKQQYVTQEARYQPKPMLSQGVKL